ncbi:DNA helicase [Salmonella phage vB_SnwM_CGG4-1]|uniref:DNA helicase n=1 Tax=Salmonella phage vB_SnwM_CGG4-1 TaxID=1815631 RepID=A0A1B0VV18_9CAUD|nr:DNA helicase [Salmonella phage vB_SnwM_CGG4-1]ANA49368.1 DNA helicase [Salmonella phage vB_SnwM_CGG4-1]
MKITFEDLTIGQKNAFDETIKAIKEKKNHVTINGPAGTGKTTLTKFIMEHLVSTGETGIILTAPTHAAKKVLTKLSGMEANTIHKILKINPTTYEESMLFEQKEVPDLASCRVLICDEASMWDRKLFKILMASIPKWCTIVAIGDVAQIRPVDPGETETHISPFFIHKDFKQLNLTEVMRSNAPIIDVATDIRNGSWIYEKTVDGHGVHGFTSTTALKDFMMQYFSIVKSPEDLFENRMLAFTNKSVDKLNSIIRRRLYQTEEAFVIGEVIVMQEPLMRELVFEGKKFHETLFTNGQYVRILSADYTSSFLGAKGVSGEHLIRHWVLDVETYDDEEYAREKINVISDEQEMNKFQFFLAKTADTYKNWNKGGKAPWSEFWDAKRKFHKVKALPCSTFHKAQGISVDSSFIYTPCIHVSSDNKFKLELLYVGATRGRHDVFFV